MNGNMRKQILRVVDGSGCLEKSMENFLPSYIKLYKAFSKPFISINFCALLIKGKPLWHCSFVSMGVGHQYIERSWKGRRRRRRRCWKVTYRQLSAMFSPKGKKTKKLSQGIGEINDFLFDIRKIE